MRRVLIAAGAAVLAIAIFAGARQAREGSGAPAQTLAPLTLAQVSKPVAGVPPKLAALRRQVNVLLGGGDRALAARLRALRGYPVVVNMWGSWCDPCRRELPIFQRQAVKRSAAVAFLGVNVDDARDEAQKLAARFPMPYPSFEDPRYNIAAGRFAVRGLPATAFYDRAGHVTVRQGEISNEATLSSAIERYALR